MTARETIPATIASVRVFICVPSWEFGQAHASPGGLPNDGSEVNAR
jgi:hypothetical protein